MRGTPLDDIFTPMDIYRCYAQDSHSVNLRDLQEVSNTASINAFAKMLWLKAPTLKSTTKVCLPYRKRIGR